MREILRSKSLCQQNRLIHDEFLENTRKSWFLLNQSMTSNRVVTLVVSRGVAYFVSLVMIIKLELSWGFVADKVFDLLNIGEL